MSYEKIVSDTSLYETIDIIKDFAAEIIDWFVDLFSWVGPWVGGALIVGVSLAIILRICGR